MNLTVKDLNVDRIKPRLTGRILSPVQYIPIFKETIALNNIYGIRDPYVGQNVGRSGINLDLEFLNKGVFQTKTYTGESLEGYSRPLSTIFQDAPSHENLTEVKKKGLNLLFHHWTYGIYDSIWIMPDLEEGFQKIKGHLEDLRSW